MTPEQAFNKLLINKKRDKDLESIIIKSPKFSWLYAMQQIKGRWIEAEDVISTDPFFTYYYAQDLINGKLPENMHNAMLLHFMSDNEFAKEYAEMYFEFIKNKTQP